MSRCLPAFMAAAALLLAPSLASPTPSPYRPRILLDVRPVSGPTACSTWSLSECSQAVTHGDADPGDVKYYYVYLVVARGDSMQSLAGVQCGISYDYGQPGNISDLAGIDIFAWHLCATMEFPTTSPSWPAPRSGNLITWDSIRNCQTGALAVAGYFYVGAYSASFLGVYPRPVDNAAKVAGCDAVEVTLHGSELGLAAFAPGGPALGCNPCLDYCWHSAGDVVLPTTWSSVKASFRQ